MGAVRPATRDRDWTAVQEWSRTSDCAGAVAVRAGSGALPGARTGPYGGTGGRRIPARRGRRIAEAAGRAAQRAGRPTGTRSHGGLTGVGRGLLRTAHRDVAAAGGSPGRCGGRLPARPAQAAGDPRATRGRDNPRGTRVRLCPCPGRAHDETTTAQGDQATLRQPGRPTGTTHDA